MNGHLDDIHLGMYKKYSKYYRALPMLWWKKKAPVSSSVDGIVEKEKFFVSLMQQFLTFNFVSLWLRAYVFLGNINLWSGHHRYGHQPATYATYF